MGRLRTGCRSATSWRASSRTARRSWMSRSCSTSTRTRTRRARRVVADIAASVAEAARGLNRYPDREVMELRADLAAYLGRESGAQLDAEQIWAANGSNEVMLQLLQAFGGPGRTALVVRADVLDASGVRARHRPALGRRARVATTSRSTRARRSRRSRGTGRPSCCWPRRTTRPVPRCRSQLVEAIADRTASIGAVVVVDEAYAEFARPGTPSAVTLLPAYPRSGGGPHACRRRSRWPGARLGYLAASRQLVERCSIVRLPYHLSALTQAVARVALRHSDELLGQRSRAAGRAGRDRGLAARPTGLQAVDSDANFVLFGRSPTGTRVWQALLDDGVLIRETGPARLAAGDDRHRAPRWTRSARRWQQVLETRGHGHDADGPDRAGDRRSPGRSSSSTSTAPGSADILTGVGFYDHMLDALGQARA